MSTPIARHDAARTGPTHQISGRTVLVTGGAGFVGSHLAEALVEENDVRILDDFSTGRRENVPDGATVHEGDLRDGDALATAIDGVDLIFHQAGLVSVPRSVERPRLSNELNVGATVQLLEGARAADARVVAASSVAIYGQPDGVPIAEDDPTDPESPYGVDKLALDHYVRLFAELYDLPTVALRYFNVYGPRQSAGQYSGVISTFLEQARAGEPITVHGDGTQTRDFVHVSDVVHANLAAARTDDVGRAFNVGTGESVSVRELAETVRAVVGSNSDIVHTDPRPGDVRRSRADVSRARAELDFEPRVDLEEGLRALATDRDGGVDRGFG